MVSAEPVRSQRDRRCGHELDDGEEGDPGRHDAIHAAGIDA
jgi:hypothetical protein